MTVPTGVLPGATGWDIIGYGSDGVVRYRPADGTVTVTPIPVLSSNGPYSFVTTPRFAILRPLDSVTGYAIPVEGHAIELPGLLGAGGPLLPGPNPNTVWVADGSGVSAGLRLVDLEGRALGPTITMSSIGPDSWPAPDGSGYAMISGTGGTYDARPDGLRLITHGRVLAAGRTGFLVYECTDDARCGVAVVNRTGTTRTPLHGVVASGFPAAAQGLISPDGAFAAFTEVVGGQANQSELHLVNLKSGLDRVVPDALDTAQSFSFTPAFAFSPDGAWLLYTTHSGHLAAIDTATGRVTTLATTIPQVSTVVVQADH